MIPNWKEKFFQKFVREDGLIDKYYFDENGELDTSTNLITKFIEQELQAAYERGKEECLVSLGAKETFSEVEQEARAELLEEVKVILHKYLDGSRTGHEIIEKVESLTSKHHAPKE